MSDSQAIHAVNSAAIAAGIARAHAAQAVSSHEDRRIQYDDIVTMAPPAFLTNDYDPTYRPSAITRDGHFEHDAEARELAEYMIHNGQWKRCPECGSGIATGLRAHVTCEQAKNAGAA